MSTQSFRRIGSLAGVLAVAGVACPAAHAASLTYTAQTRTVTATAANFNYYNQMASAPDFGPFNGSVNVSAPSDNPDPSYGTASQQSQLLPNAVTMSGQVGGKDNYGINGIGEGSGRSMLNVSFTLDAASGFQFDDNPTVTSGVGPEFYRSASLTNTTLNTTVFSFSGNQYSAPSETGTLTPGTYTLQISFSNGGGGSGTTGGLTSYAATLVVPEPTGAAWATLVLLPLIGRRGRSAHAAV